MISARNILGKAKASAATIARPASRTFSVVDDSSAMGVAMKEHISKMRMTHSFEPIPYDPNLPIVPLNFVDSSELQHKKVTVVGCGQVGMAIAYAMLNQTTAGTIALIDQAGDKLSGEAKDLEQGSAFHGNVRIEADTDYAVSNGSHLVIITAGAAQKVGESRLELVGKNVAIMKNIIPNVLAHSPHAAICIVSNPCDIMTAVAAKIAGPAIPAGRIFGSGTCLDSSRLQSLLGRTLGIEAQSVQGYVVGEHGDSSVPVWSSVRVGGVPMLFGKDGPDAILDAMHRDVVESAGDVIRKKGYTNWAVGLTNAHIAKAILTDSRSIMPLSTCVRGIQGIQEDVFLSMPCSVGAHGVRRVIDLPLSPLEKELFLKSRDAVWATQKGIWDML
jgi:L-lactate dehydrogenase